MHLDMHNAQDISDNKTCDNHRCNSYNTSVFENVSIHEDVKTTKVDNMRMSNCKEGSQNIFIDSPLILLNKTKRKSDVRKRKRDDDNNSSMDANSNKSEALFHFLST